MIELLIEYAAPLGVAVLAILGFLGNNKFQRSKGKHEAEVEQIEADFEAHKRKEKRENETEDTNRALPRRELFGKLRKQASKDGE